jgi:ATP-binding cassette subfamily C (CFTR/MRP) protein 1
VLEFIGVPQEAPLVIDGRRPQLSWPTQGEIRLEKVTMRYRPELELVLKGLNLHVKPQQKIGKL